LGDDGSLEDGLFEFLYGSTVGAGSFSIQNHIKAIAQGLGYNINFRGQVYEFLTVGKQASTQAGNVTQNGIGSHLKRSDEDEGMSGRQHQYISVGDVVADDEVIFQLQAKQLFRIDDIDIEAENLEKFAAYGGSVMRQAVTQAEGFPVKEFDEQSAYEKNCQPVDNTQKSPATTHPASSSPDKGLLTLQGGFAVSHFALIILPHLGNIEQGEKIDAAKTFIQGRSATDLGADFQI
jgi:hypothetical protein